MVDRPRQRLSSFVLYALATILRPTIAVGARTLRTIIGLGCASLVGALGWWLGGLLNLGAAVILGGIGSGVGLYYGQKWFDNNLR
jgi:hypothetical protein